MSQQISIFDLDETITPFNTFRPFLLVVFASLLLCGQFKTAARCGRLLIAKAFGCLDHIHFKAAICKCAEQLPPVSTAWFAAFCKLMARPALVREIENRRSYGDLLILCTAAPALYADCLAKSLGFDLSIAYGGSIGSWTDGVDNVGLVKVKCLESIVPDLRERVEAAYSDHVSDLPLLQLARRPVLVHPRTTHILAIQKVIPEIQIVK